MKSKTKPTLSRSRALHVRPNIKVPGSAPTLAPTTPPLVSQSVAAGLVRAVEGMLDAALQTQRVNRWPVRRTADNPSPSTEKLGLQLRHRTELKKLRQRQRAERWALAKREKLTTETEVERSRSEKAEAKKRLSAALSKLRGAYGDSAVYLVRGERMKIWPDGEGGFYFRRVGTHNGKAG